MNKLKLIINKLVALDLQTNGKVCKLILAMICFLAILLIIIIYLYLK